MAKPALMGIFIYLDDLLGALTAVKEADLDFTVFSPSAAPRYRRP